MSTVYINTSDTGLVTATWESQKLDLIVERQGSSSASALAKLARALGEMVEEASPPQ